MLVNPNTGTSPVFRSRRDAEITINVYKHVPVLWRDDPEENPWGLSFLRMFDMTNDSGMFRSRHQLEQDGWILTGNIFASDGKRMLPLYEAKMIYDFDDRYGTYEGQTEAQANVGILPRLNPQQQNDAHFAVEPRYWVQEYDTKDEDKSTSGKPAHLTAGVTSRLAGKHWPREWLLGWRDITRANNERTLISAVLPRVGVGNTLFLALPAAGSAELLYANLASFVLDYLARQKLSGNHLTYSYFTQLPVLSPDAYSQLAPWLNECLADWIRTRVLELSFTSWAVAAFACDLGDDRAPFRWDEERRMQIRAELDAAYFHIYGLPRDDVEHVMDSFEVLGRREERQLGEFRTKRLIMERYDGMAEAARTGHAYQTVLDPPPGHGSRHTVSG